jgi:hypothetical protein
MKLGDWFFPYLRVLSSFPYFEKRKEAYEITLLSICLSVRASPSACGSLLITEAYDMRSPFSLCVPLNFFVVCAVRAVSDEIKRLVLPRTSIYNFNYLGYTITVSCSRGLEI